MLEDMTTQTRSQTRCFSPVFPKDESNCKKLKIDRHSDCKTVSNKKNVKQNDIKEEDNSGEGLDSPAFRLRPRRSTPKPTPSSHGKRFSPFTAMMERLKHLKDGSDVKRKLLFNKQKVYPSTFNSDENVPLIRVIPPRSPTSSVKEDIFVSPFVPKISTKELEMDKEYGVNYISLKIIMKEDLDLNGEKLVKLIATGANIEETSQASTSKSIETVVYEPKISIYLFGTYVNCRAEKDKIINIVKFKTKSQPLVDSDQPIGGDFDFAIVVQSSPEENWIPFVSITNTWKPPEDPRELNKTLFIKAPDGRRPEFSSYTSKK
ncbi:uncharacterized protein LOC128959944 [Oppia nitens]|uniref:uncharacterized protein LOC128959944 n=1 Tax=Oppia nitens TaxID=1686743 RepID=UPI0023DCDAD0|nr:uncharacterized protein LOC128959944 [Oppia nitens]XP_054161969.1 uncharacterized protein LOC128959944 [Oppia nitens]XP_054161977.1 uncharacterized protein LOC128959944 [Oppia nitens]